MDVATKKFTQLTDFDGHDSWPMWGNDGGIYFVSDRDGNGLTNIWRVSADGSKAERITSFKSGDVRWPAASSDGRTIVFEHDFGIWKLDVTSKKATPIPLNIAAETQENLSEVPEFQFPGQTISIWRPRRDASRFQFTAKSLPRRSKKVISTTDRWRGARPQRRVIRPTANRLRLFRTAAAAKKFTWSRPTARERRDRSPISTLSSSATAGRPIPKKLRSPLPTAKCAKWMSRRKKSTELDSSNYGKHQHARVVARWQVARLSKSDITRTSDIYLIASSGSEKEHTRLPSIRTTMRTRFLADGRKLFFQRIEATRWQHSKLGSDLFRGARTSGTRSGRCRRARRSRSRRRCRQTRTKAQRGAAGRRRMPAERRGPPQRNQDGLGWNEAAHAPNHAHAVPGFELHRCARQPHR